LVPGYAGVRVCGQRHPGVPTVPGIPGTYRDPPIPHLACRQGFRVTRRAICWAPVWADLSRKVRVDGPKSSSRLPGLPKPEPQTRKSCPAEVSSACHMNHSLCCSCRHARRRLWRRPPLNPQISCYSLELTALIGEGRGAGAPLRAGETGEIYTDTGPAKSGRGPEVNFPLAFLGSDRPWCGGWRCRPTQEKPTKRRPRDLGWTPHPLSPEVVDFRPVLGQRARLDK
jgi:hypothetical protein